MRQSHVSALDYAEPCQSLLRDEDAWKPQANCVSRYSSVTLARHYTVVYPLIRMKYILVFYPALLAGWVFPILAHPKPIRDHYVLAPKWLLFRSCICHPLSVA